eukprot:338300_1
MTSLLQSQGFKQILSGLQKIHTDYACAFSIVRDPLTRLISAYYTINLMEYHRYLKNETKVAKFRFWNIHSEPERFQAFVDDLLENPYEFVRHKKLNHVTSQTQILSLAPVNFKYILKFKHFKHQLKLLTTTSQFCGETLNVSNIGHRMNSFGGKGHFPMPKKYSEMMDFQKYENHSLLPAWYGLNYETWSKITEYYKQDYACFGFKQDFNEIASKIALSH